MCTFATLYWFLKPIAKKWKGEERNMLAKLPLPCSYLFGHVFTYYPGQTSSNVGNFSNSFNQWLVFARIQWLEHCPDLVDYMIKIPVGTAFITWQLSAIGN